MLTNHWGKWVNSDQPVGGVVSIHSVEWVNDECSSGREIDLTWESELIEFKADKLREYRARYGDKRNPSPRTVAKWVAECGENYDGGNYDQRYLIGDWVKDSEGKYDPDSAGEYAAIVHYDGGMTIQIVHSKFATRAALCSPCYPGQVDLDSVGDYLGYDLPPELYGERRQNPNPQIELGRRVAGRFAISAAQSIPDSYMIRANEYTDFDDCYTHYVRLGVAAFSELMKDANATTPIRGGDQMLLTNGWVAHFDLPLDYWNRLEWHDIAELQNSDIAQPHNPPLYTITVQVHRVIDGIVQVNPSIYEEENLFYATAQAPRGDLQHITNIARGLWNLADDQLRSMPE